MGINGLLPLVKRYTPDVFKTLPLTEYQGRRVAVDGNVFTLKFHFANDPHPNRTILSWYRFLNNLRSYDIHPVVVFDGSSRVSAKARELQRRMQARQLVAGRATSEEARVSRLATLKTVVGELRQLQPAARNNMLEQTQKILDTKSTDDLAVPRDMSAASLSDRFADLVWNMQTARIAERDQLSRRQLEIAHNEAQIFTKMLVSPSAADVAADEQDPLDALETILGESKGVAQTYEKRAAPLSAQTKTDCMEVIKAMGIPVILTSQDVPVEAESLCSSLVAADLADVVVSEDTDVLVFDAPLLRRMWAGSRDGELIFGQDVRDSLKFPTREAFIDFCLLCGCDFTERIKGLGPVKAYKLIMEYGSIEAIVAAHAFPKSILPPEDLDGYLLSVSAGRAIYTSPAPVDTIDKASLELKAENPNLSKIMRGFGYDPRIHNLTQKHGFEDQISSTDAGLSEAAQWSDSPFDGNAQFPEEEYDGFSQLYTFTDTPGATDMDVDWAQPDQRHID